ncbi:MAG: glucosidase, partial [Gemmatimonadota bacterium]|nr:glucosidase [Gemmatimonadota bacterium]
MSTERSGRSAGREADRLARAHAGGEPWLAWGPYLSERQWGTVREDYSPHGTAWDAFPHDHARSRAYRWGEDGIAGLSDDGQRLCFSLALWNGRDPILKERLYGLTGPEGNHGEDVKEEYFYLDSTPTHSWMRMLYKYPQAEYPYARLVSENARRGKDEPEFELRDAGAFEGDRYFDVFVEVAKCAPEDLLVRIRAVNRGPDEAELHILPQLVFRNTWSWEPDAAKPEIAREADGVVAARHAELGTYRLHCDGGPELLFTENETNTRRLFGDANAPGSFKDAFHDRVVGGDASAVSTEARGTKAAAHYRFAVGGGETAEVRLRLTRKELKRPFQGFEKVMTDREAEADAFYAELERGIDGPDARLVHRQALAGLLWTKQWYHYDVDRWLEGDPAQPPPPPGRRHGRNAEWTHLNNADIISMPDKWEYPWYAAWDLAFHCLPLALVDAEFAKQQLVLMTREWYMHPNGQLPAYEWAFGDVNPPVHAWATWRVYKIDKARNGGPGDRAFLERVFHKLLLNFTWWVNRKDAHGHNLFQGGFLGLDNIGVFDRSAPLPTGGHIEQADGTSWMAMYALNLMRIALELAEENPVYQDLATKFFEHFLHIAGAMANIGGEGIDLWDEEDGFFYDVLHLPHH